MKIDSTILSIYSQGGLCDRGVATILERRLPLIHSTLAGVKKRHCLNSTPFYIGGGCVNPYQSYAGEAPQTLTTPTAAGLKKDLPFHVTKTPHKPRFSKCISGALFPLYRVITRYLSPKCPGGGKRNGRINSLERKGSPAQSLQPTEAQRDIFSRDKYLEIIPCSSAR